MYVWKAYGKITTLHWLVKKAYENLGVGRLCFLLWENIKEDECLYFFIQPLSYPFV